MGLCYRNETQHFGGFNIGKIIPFWLSSTGRQEGPLRQFAPSETFAPLKFGPKTIEKLAVTKEICITIDFAPSPEKIPGGKPSFCRRFFCVIRKLGAIRSHFRPLRKCSVTILCMPMESWTRPLWGGGRALECNLTGRCPFIKNLHNPFRKKTAFRYPVSEFLNYKKFQKQ